WMLKDKKTIRARLMLAAYLDSEPVEYRNTITMVLQLMNVNKKDTTYTYFDMRRPIKSMRPGQPDPSLCPPPNNCDIEGEVSDL
ncbi:MAG TPA: hypothetical protein VLJ68_13165, partial [Chitinophagaceae bacterium]|nr:hypothetical protein [Chitinophagaceae bacterium]